MLISGLQKLTLLDYPEKTACTVFTYGCNFRCPFCHNALLVTEKLTDVIDEEEVFDYLKKRQGILDGVCITGGEPTNQKDLIPFMKKVKELGYLVKLDTNGYNYTALSQVLSEGVCDYVAMDVKNSLPKYSLTAGVDINTEEIVKSIELIRSKAPEYEFRTTVVKEFHTKDDLEEICRLVGKESDIYFQQFVDSGNLIGKNLSPWSEQEITETAEYLRSLGYKAHIRGK